MKRWRSGPVKHSRWARRADGLFPGRAMPINSAMKVTMGRGILGRIEVIFFGVLILVVAAVWVYQSYAVDPVQHCEASGNWWDARTRTCGHVVYLPDLTHRRPGAKTPSYPTLPETAVQGAGGTSGTR